MRFLVMLAALGTFGCAGMNLCGAADVHPLVAVPDGGAPALQPDGGFELGFCNRVCLGPNVASCTLVTVDAGTPMVRCDETVVGC